MAEDWSWGLRSQLPACLCLIFVGGNEDEIQPASDFLAQWGEVGLVPIQVRALGALGGSAWLEEIQGVGEETGLTWLHF